MKRATVLMLAGLLGIAGAIGTAKVVANEKADVKFQVEERKPQNLDSSSVVAKRDNKNVPNEAKTLREEMIALHNEIKSLHSQKQPTENDHKEEQIRNRLIQLLEQQKSANQMSKENTEALDKVITVLKK
ncbi:hypothetical protein [Fictibacillus sp. NRS-1165]|uniref:hypothetical protein n=1 Tax=Fictibacillus sp. NRS-1165 TaxID=3144463 RepID=UPI003D2554A5